MTTSPLPFRNLLCNFPHCCHGVQLVKASNQGSQRTNTRNTFFWSPWRRMDPTIPESHWTLVWYVSIQCPSFGLWRDSLLTKDLHGYTWFKLRTNMVRSHSNYVKRVIWAGRSGLSGLVLPDSPVKINSNKTLLVKYFNSDMTRSINGF
jgi:hypothetical protein